MKRHHKCMQRTLRYTRQITKAHEIHHHISDIFGFIYIYIYIYVYIYQLPMHEDSISRTFHNQGFILLEFRLSISIYQEYSKIPYEKPSLNRACVNSDPSTPRLTSNMRDYAAFCWCMSLTYTYMFPWFQTLTKSNAIWYTTDRHWKEKTHMMLKAASQNEKSNTPEKFDKYIIW